MIVVDDGSQDSTAQAAQESVEEIDNFRVIRNEANRGKGYSVKTGMAQVRGRYAGFMDADYKTDITCLKDALTELNAGSEVVIGSRKLENSEIKTQPKLYRRIGSLLYNRYIRMVLPKLGRYADTQCGFKFFRLDASREIFPRLVVDRFMFDVETLYLAHLLNFTVTEIPVRWSSDHDSRTTILESILRNSLDLIRIRFTHRNLTR